MAGWLAVMQKVRLSTSVCDLTRGHGQCMVVYLFRRVDNFGGQIRFRDCQSTQYERRRDVLMIDNLDRINVQ